MHFWCNFSSQFMITFERCRHMIGWISVRCTTIMWKTHMVSLSRPFSTVCFKTEFEEYRYLNQRSEKIKDSKSERIEGCSRSIPSWIATMTFLIPKWTFPCSGHDFFRIWLYPESSFAFHRSPELAVIREAADKISLEKFDEILACRWNFVRDVESAKSLKGTTMVSLC